MSPPNDFGASEYAWSFEIVTDHEQQHPNSIVTNASKPHQGTENVDVEGRPAKQSDHFHESSL
jgi:hypothetical protein